MHRIALQVPSFADPTTEPFSRFDILKRYLEDETATADSIAIDVTASINGPVSVAYPVLDDDIAGGQEKLVALVAAIKILPSPPRLDVDGWLFKGYGPLWQALPVFGPSVYDIWSSQGLLHEIDTTFCMPLSREGWVNFNAFMARITAAQLMDLSSSAEALFARILENDNTTSSKLNDNVPAAAVWILYAGNVVHENVLKEGRWTLVKERFAALVRDEALHNNTPDWALGAFEEMCGIEANKTAMMVDK